MPLYEFECRGCGNFDKKLSFEEAGSAQQCPRCAEPARRVFSSVQFRLTPTAATVARTSDRETIRRAKSGEPRIERRAIDPQPPKASWQPLHGGHSPKRHHE